MCTKLRHTWPPLSTILIPNNNNNMHDCHPGQSGRPQDARVLLVLWPKINTSEHTDVSLEWVFSWSNSRWIVLRITEHDTRKPSQQTLSTNTITSQTMVGQDNHQFPANLAMSVLMSPADTGPECGPPTIMENKVQKQIQETDKILNMATCLTMDKVYWKQVAIHWLSVCIRLEEKMQSTRKYNQVFIVGLKNYELPL